MDHYMDVMFEEMEAEMEDFVTYEEASEFPEFDEDKEAYEASTRSGIPAF